MRNVTTSITVLAILRPFVLLSLTLLEVYPWLGVDMVCALELKHRIFKRWHLSFLLP